MARSKLPALPAPADLERICKGLAVLDAIVTDDWEYRYYSFTSKWNKKGKERMGSMRNGSGDDWFIQFSPAGTFVKAYWHEYKHEDADAIYAGLPAKLAPQLEEAAFWPDDAVTFGGWHDGKSWTLRGNAKPMKEELAVLSGEPKHYRAYVAEVHELAVPLESIAHVLAGKKLDAKLVTSINPETTLSGLKSDLADIGY